MTIEVNGLTYYRTARAYVKAVTNRIKGRREWIPCPRCIGGIVYRETSGEHVCIQCGCSYYPDKLTKPTSATKDSLKLELKPYESSVNILQGHRIGNISNESNAHNPG